MAKINSLLLLAAAAGGGYYIYSQNSKKQTAIAASVPDYLKKKGYYFVNCDSVVVLDEQKAFKYAYNVAKLMNPVVWDALLWDGCGAKTLQKIQPYFTEDTIDLEKVKQEPNKVSLIGKDPKQSKFIFDLIRYAALGLVDGQGVDPQMAETIFKNQLITFQDKGIDTSSWDTTLPSKP